MPTLRHYWLNKKKELFQQLIRFGGILPRFPNLWIQTANVKVFPKHFIRSFFLIDTPATYAEISNFWRSFWSIPTSFNHVESKILKLPVWNWLGPWLGSWHTWHTQKEFEKIESLQDWHTCHSSRYSKMLSFGEVNEHPTYLPLSHLLQTVMLYLWGPVFRRLTHLTHSQNIWKSKVSLRPTHLPQFQIFQKVKSWESERTSTLSAA